MKALGTALCMIALAAPGSPATADTTLIASRIVMPDGSLAEGKAVVIGEDGRIARIVNAADVEDGADVIRYEDGSVLSPGLIDVNSYLGVRGDNRERKHAIDPEARVLEAFDPYAEELETAVRAGVTAAMIAPSTENVIPGQCATVRTWSDDGSADVLNGRAALSVVLASSTFSASREPSSRAGAMHLLRTALEESENATIADALAGELPVLVTCEAGQDVAAALTLFGPGGVKPIIVHSIDAARIAEDVADAETAVVLGPYSFDNDPITLSGAAALQEAGARTVICGQVGAGDPDRLRIGAALAARSGLEPEAARRSITSEAAEVAGVADETGAIREGLAADLVIFSGDPLRLDARVLEVWIEGRRAFTAASSSYNHDKVIGATHD